MGVVYRAYDTRLGRAVALKFLLPPYSLDASAKARFLREARAAATLDHPNLCVIHDVGATDDGRLYLAMALYAGETLKARLARVDGMAAGEVLGIATQLAAGLEAAHAGGIVHRDLKPGNVMLLPNGAVKILDFGLAKATDQGLSESGAQFGTVSYMAPEQIRGAAVDRRADLWAFGVVLYEMLTGRKPFVGERDIAIAHAILHDRPVPPSRYRGDLPTSLEHLVLRLLQKAPARRCSDANEVLSALALAVTNTEEGRHPWRRRLRRAIRAWADRRQLTLSSLVRS
jgi:serine/threonine-protein kinase